MPYVIIYVKNVIKKDLRELSSPVLKQIKRTIEQRLMVDPVGHGKPLRYNLKGCRRLRVGDYRIVYQINDQTVTILAIKHRKKIYS